MNKIIQVGFISKKIKEAYEKLKEGKFEDQKLYSFITRAIEDLKKDPQCGVRIPQKLIPKEWKQKYELTNLWKYNLPNAWRLLYEVIGNEVKIVCVILNFMNHKEYERWFKY